MRKRTTTDAIEIIHQRFYAERPHRIAQFHEAMVNDEIARKISELRNAAHLTQRQLAARIGTTASVICRLEDADYQGHSLSMLRRIAAALDNRVEIRFVPARRKTVAV